MTYLVTGATGTVGRHVVEQLVEAGHAVRALSRTPERANLPEGVEVVGGDLAKPETLEAAFAGVVGVHLINFAGDDYGALENGRRIVELLVANGVRRVTLLGGREEGELETALAASGIQCAYLHPVEFMSNTRLWWAEAVRTEGVVREPFGGRLSALVHEADIAAVAVAALTEDGHGGRTYTITGPEALTTTEKIRILSEAVGREIGFVELTEEQAREKWSAEGMPPPVIDFLIDALGNTPEVGYTVVPTVERVTGRPARTFAQWAAENAGAFRS
ncbi:NAD(P)H-binding protein [Bailinhaonella thermotolerans]|uniref:NAD-dependent epimerase/dehydratase family protein n=1 Tax=Bailinhaonella thermotolerans TaxID=1070861 RepID=A0A3A4B1P4_9ACTN|nr:NAD(P)H-binding protein [Bailinhaonella thermotolerans]RJL31947.1 NAD-dependent epimerase/dehydratase family protein [Bailinhaonella thermotolerans]